MKSKTARRWMARNGWKMASGKQFSWRKFRRQMRECQRALLGRAQVGGAGVFTAPSRKHSLVYVLGLIILMLLVLFLKGG